MIMDSGDEFSDPFASMVSVSPEFAESAFELDDPELFNVNDLADFMEGQTQDNTSPIFDYLSSSESEKSVVDVENFDNSSSSGLQSRDIKYEVNLEGNSASDNELVQYLSRNDEKFVAREKQNNDEETLKDPLKLYGNRLHGEKNFSTISGNNFTPAVRVIRRPMRGGNNTINIVKRRQSAGDENNRSCSPENESNSIKGQCLSKSAVAARENRQKKKKYIEQLEKNVHHFKEENGSLKSKVQRLETEVESLTSEVAYLRNVLANQSTLSKLLKNIPNVPGVRLLSSEIGKEVVGNVKSGVEKRDGRVPMSNLKRPLMEDHEYASAQHNSAGNDCASDPSKKLRIDTSTKTSRGGVCLHVEEVCCLLCVTVLLRTSFKLNP